ncbi:hypothetical protein [Streptomyces sp. NPDC048332]|uniref:hypothetical protein n=1 Tax=unclassified Streptomyces TaxID=2593676 RepID=UPI00343A8A71
MTAVTALDGRVEDYGYDSAGRLDEATASPTSPSGTGAARHPRRPLPQGDARAATGPERGALPRRGRRLCLR